MATPGIAGPDGAPPEPAVRILLIPGSLRARSTSGAVLRTMQAMASSDVAATLYDGLGGLPHFNPDDDVEPVSPAVAELRRMIRAAGALVFSTPEYAGALPGSFKNLLDWTIGDGEIGSIHEKPVAWVNASPRGATGAHASLRTVLGYANATVVESACVDVPVTAAMIGDHGLIAAEEVRSKLAAALAALGAA